MLVFNHYEKSYGGRLLLRADIALAPGAWWLKAPNGAGKSSLFRSIAGIIPFEGSISIDGIDQRRQRIAYAKLVSWAEAEPVYPAFLTGNDLLDFYKKMRGATTSDAVALLEVFAASSYMHTRVGTWSSGMVKKLSLVLALLGTPRWVLLDEPLITLDTAAQQACLDVIRERAGSGTSFLITSHQPLGLVPTPQDLFIRDQMLVQ